MIKNIFYGLTIALSAAAIFFGYQTKNTLSERISETADRMESNETVTKNINDKSEEIKVAKVDKQTAVATRNETSASLDNEGSKENALRTSLATIESQIEEHDAELVRIEENLAEARALISELVPSAGANLDIDAVVAHIESLEEEAKQKEADLEDKIDTAAKLSQQVTRANSQKDSYQSRLGNFRKRIALNGVTATVTAAENGYGFVVLNRGANNSNINEQSNLLVSRGGSFVGRLTVQSIEPNQTIANIDQDSLKPGQRIQAGDRVILETPVSN